MNRNRVIVAWAVFLATFLWLLFPVEGPGPRALWPSAVAVGLAFVTRDIYLSLFLGAFSGAILLRDGNVAGAFLDLPALYLLPALQNPWNVSVLVFTLMMGGFVELLNRQGGMAALADCFLGRSRTRRRAGMGVFTLGWVMFIDGLANAMLVGRTMRPIADRARLSREKLAFIVDSTSSPIAGLALISTWVAYEMSVIREGFENLGDPARWGGVAPFQMLVESLPYRFYNYLVLWIVFLTIWLGRDYGPMLKAERRAAAQPEAKAAVEEPGESRWGRVFVALLPLMVLIFVVFGGLYVQGGGLEAPLTLANMIAAFGRADAALVFVCATAFAVVVAMLVGAVFPNGRSEGGMVRIFFEGMNRMFLPALILVFAWMLNAIIQEIGTAPYLVSLLGDRLPAVWLPAMVFLLAAVVSFSTGTSWGTMAIVMPLVIPLAVALSGVETAIAGGGVLVPTIGAVLAGAVFGDHCSPISDTTIVSAVSSDCDAMEHVRTQMPYAMTAAVLAVALGYGPAGWGIHPGWLLGAGLAACWAMVRFAGQRGQS